MKKLIFIISILILTACKSVEYSFYYGKLFDDRFVKIDNKNKTIRNIRTNFVYHRMQNRHFIQERTILKSNDFNLIHIYDGDILNKKSKIYIND